MRLGLDEEFSVRECRAWRFGVGRLRVLLWVSLLGVCDRWVVIGSDGGGGVCGAWRSMSALLFGFGRPASCGVVTLLVPIGGWSWRLVGVGGDR